MRQEWYGTPSLLRNITCQFINFFDNIRGMQDPANGVVNEFGFRKCLMTALVSNDPETSRK